MNSKNLIFIIILFTGMQVTFCMMQPPQPPKASWNSLPTEIRRYIFQYIASSNVYEVAETIKALNATGRFCHAVMQSEQIIMNIMQRMPYLDNQLYLFELLAELPVMAPYRDYFNPLMQSWRASLAHGEEIHSAIRENNQEQLEFLLNKRNADLGGNSLGVIEPLCSAIFRNNAIIVKRLLQAGANPDGVRYAPMRYALRNENKEIVQLLLQFGASTNVHLYQIEEPDFLKLFVQAKLKRIKRLRLLCGKKDDGCIVS